MRKTLLTILFIFASLTHAGAQHISGYVFFATCVKQEDGSVKTDVGTPAVGAAVHYRDFSRDYSSRVDENGHYSIDLPENGYYLLSLEGHPWGAAMSLTEAKLNIDSFFNMAVVYVRPHGTLYSEELEAAILAHYNSLLDSEPGLIKNDDGSYSREGNRLYVRMHGDVLFLLNY